MLLRTLFTLTSALVATVSAWTSYKLNCGHSWAFWLTWSIGCIPVWTLWAKLSDNILLDAIIYDSVVIAIFAVVTMHLTGKQISLEHMLGIMMLIMGIVLVNT